MLCLVVIEADLSIMTDSGDIFRVKKLDSSIGLHLLARKLHCSGYQDTVKSQGTNKPTHWLRRAPKLHKHILEKHPTTLLNYRIF